VKILWMDLYSGMWPEYKDEFDKLIRGQHQVRMWSTASFHGGPERADISALSKIKSEDYDLVVMGNYGNSGLGWVTHLPAQTRKKMILNHSGLCKSVEDEYRQLEVLRVMRRTKFWEEVRAGRITALLRESGEDE